MGREDVAEEKLKKRKRGDTVLLGERDEKVVCVMGKKLRIRQR